MGPTNPLIYSTIHIPHSTFHTEKSQLENKENKNGELLNVDEAAHCYELSHCFFGQQFPFVLFCSTVAWILYCDQNRERCCYPPTGKPGPDFTVYGFWPYYNDGSFPYNCGGGNFNEALLKPMQGSLEKTWPSFTCPQIGRKFWVHEWNKHGSCSKNVLGEMAYFQAAIKLKSRINILHALTRAGIHPNNQMYPLKAIKKAISRSTGGFHPWVDCNHDSQGRSQIWQVSMCVDKSGSKLVNCPFLPKGRGGCGARVKFPSY